MGPDPTFSNLLDHETRILRNKQQHPKEAVFCETLCKCFLTGPRFPSKGGLRGPPALPAPACPSASLPARLWVDPPQVTLNFLQNQDPLPFLTAARLCALVFSLIVKPLLPQLQPRVPAMCLLLSCTAPTALRSVL